MNKEFKLPTSHKDIIEVACQSLVMFLNEKSYK